MSKSRGRRERQRGKTGPAGGRGGRAPADSNAAGPAPVRSRLVIRRRLTVLLLSLASMVLLSLSFEPINWWPLAWVALAPWIVAIVASQRFGWMVFCSWLAGFLFFAANLYWLLACGYPGPTGDVLLMALAELALAAFMGVFFLLFAYVVGGLVRRWTVRAGPGGLPGAPPALLLTWLVPIGWVATEVIRGYVLSGFPWFLLAHSLHRQVALIQIADLGGAYAVSFLIAAANGLVADALLVPLFVPALGRRRPNYGLAASAATVAGLLVLTVIYGRFRIRQFDGSAAPGPRAAVVQDYVPINLAPADDHAQRMREDLARFDEHLKLSAAAAAARPAPDMVAWPETMVPESVNDEYLAITWGAPRDERLRQEWSEYIQYALDHVEQARRMDRQIRAQAARFDVALLVGAATIVPEPPGWTDGSPISVLMQYGEPVGPPSLSNPQLGRYNSAVLYQPFSRNPEGMRSPAAGVRSPATAPHTTIVKTRYDKHRLVPFGELLPFRRSWPAVFKLLRKLTPMSLLQAGRDLSPLTVTARDGRRFRFAAPICYEDVMPQAIRPLVYAPDGAKQVDFLVNISNDGWFAGTSELKQHWSTAVFRCIENRVPMARSVNCGCSGFIDSAGRPIGRLEPGVRGHLSAVLPLDGRVTLYSRLGDWPGWACVAVLFVGFALVFIRRRRAKRARRAT